MFGSRLCRALVVSGLLVGSMTSTAFASGAAAPPSAKTLTARLLTTANLGSAWKTEPSNGYTDGIPACVAKLYTTATGQHAVARRTFENVGGKASYQDRLVSFNGTAAKARATALEKSIASCPAKSGGITMTVHKLAFPVTGEQSEAFSVLFVLPKGHKVDGVFVVARRDSTVVVSTHAQQGAGTSAGVTQGKDFAVKAIDKA